MADEGLIIGLFVVAISLAGSLFLGKDYLKKLGSWIEEKRIQIIIVVLWTVILSLVVIREFNAAYASPLAMDPDYRVAFAPSYSYLVPRLYGLDYVAIFVISILAGFAIREVDAVLFGFLSSGVLLLICVISYVSWFIWYILGLGTLLDASMVTTIIWAAFLNVFRMIFPLALLATFLGSISGCLIRDFTRP
jgi:hypothetical protein